MANQNARLPRTPYSAGTSSSPAQFMNSYQSSETENRCVAPRARANYQLHCGQSLVPSYGYVASQHNVMAGSHGLLTNTNQGLNRSNVVQLFQEQPASRQSLAREYQSGGSYQEPQTASTSYLGHESLGALNSRPELSNHLEAALRLEKLNPTAFMQMKPSKKFFVVGRVFIMFHIENAGETADHGSLGMNFTVVARGEIAHHQFRRFVVVQEMSDQLFCYCCPITTYGGRGATKKGVDQTTHAIVYGGSTPPARLAEESNMNKDPIRIVFCSPDEKLSPLSRINLGQMHLIHHNVKVKKVGDVHENSLPKLIHYSKSIKNR